MTLAAILAAGCLLNAATRGTFGGAVANAAKFAADGYDTDKV
ncbi:MAG: hypothetical protein QE263_04610 [Vampirovibrionales bacterium]|nr:hypothetical protein [Vampirovibrionales bacterium]